MITAGCGNGSVEQKANVADTTSNADDGAGKIITVSIEPQRYLLEALTGKEWQVNSLLGKGTDPENFDPTISDLKKLTSSGIYMTTGVLPFENALIERVGEKKLQIVDTSNGIGILTGTHHHHTDEDGKHTDDIADPHVWSSLRNAKIIAANMCEALITFDSVNAQKYQNNYERLAKMLDEKDSEIERKLKSAVHRTFVVWHPSLSYFARDYNLNQISLGTNNKELSVESLRRNIDEVRRQNASVLFIQPDMDYGRSATVAKQAGVPVVTINPTSYNFIDELSKIAEIIATEKEKNQ